MDLSIIIVSWQVKERLEANLKSLFLSEGDFKYEVFVVDNASTDKSAEMVAEKFPQVKLIKNNENLGFAKANNQAIKLAQGSYILLLNPDMQVFPDTLQNALKWANKNQQATVSGFSLINEEGKILPQVRRFPGLFDQLMIILKVPHLCPCILNSYLLPKFDYTKAVPVDSIRGSFFLINRSAFNKISGQNKPYLDERYFIWFEEVDFCRNIYHLGGQVWYSPEAFCRDYLGQSFALVKRKKTQRYFRDSMLKYFSKWEKPWKTKILATAWKLLGLII
jgi:GT2 family glycosyltransferase